MALLLLKGLPTWQNVHTRMGNVLHLLIIVVKSNEFRNANPYLREGTSSLAVCIFYTFLETGKWNSDKIWLNLSDHFITKTIERDTWAGPTENEIIVTQHWFIVLHAIWPMVKSKHKYKSNRNTEFCIRDDDCPTIYLIIVTLQTIKLIIWSHCSTNTMLHWHDLILIFSATPRHACVGCCCIS